MKNRILINDDFKGFSIYADIITDEDEEGIDEAFNYVPENDLDKEDVKSKFRVRFKVNFDNVIMYGKPDQIKNLKRFIPKKRYILPNSPLFEGEVTCYKCYCGLYDYKKMRGIAIHEDIYSSLNCLDLKLKGRKVMIHVKKNKK